MSLHTVGYDTHYVLPASQDSVPEAFRSNRMAKPIPCSVQCVNVPALTGNAAPSGTSIIQLPCGASAGILMNGYLRFQVYMTGAAAAANSGFFWKGSTRSCTALINRISSYVNSVQVDNIQNFDQVADTLFSHSTSNDWLSHDASLMLGSGIQNFLTTGNTQSATYSYCVPLIGLMGSQQSMPLYLINGQLQVQIDWNSLNRSFCEGNGAAASGITSFAIQNVQLVYDRVQPEQAFIDHVRSQMMGGQKYVYGYTNYQNTTLINSTGSQQTFNYGLNVSSLRGVIANQVLSGDLTASASTNVGYSQASAAGAQLSQFVIQLDGRLMSSLTLDTTTNPATCFAEMQKSQGRIFDASITDPIVNNTGVAGTPAAAGGTYLTQYFAIAQSTQRVNEGLAFSGSPVSVVTVQVNYSGGAPAATYTMFITFISDFQMLIDGSGSIELVR